MFIDSWVLDWFVISNIATLALALFMFIIGELKGRH
jgi:hypothetical protein